MEYRWLNNLSQSFLEQDYLLPGQSVDDRVTIIANTAEKILSNNGFHECKIKNFAEKFKANMKKGWYSLSTPIWSNFGTDRGLPISCFGSFMDDTMESIAYTHAELMMMGKNGGGTSVYTGKIRPRGASIKNNGFSSGSVHFIQLTDTTTKITNQGSTRRGNCAVYQDIFHKDIEEFLTIRSDGSPIQDIAFGVCIPNWWIQDMINGDPDKRRIWAKVLECRQNIGFPYLFFSDNVNKNAPDVYHDLGKTIWASQMCTEICLSSSILESFVCDLSSLNMLYYDEWKDDEEAIMILVYLLDSVMTEFINKASKIQFMERAVRFAQNQRAIGIGWLGWHSLLQSKMIPFESMQAKLLNTQIAQHVEKKCLEASRLLAKEYGEPPLLKGYGRRNVTLQAIAPTKSSSFILGQVSEGIEPVNSNYIVKNLAKGKYTLINPYLVKLLAEKGVDVDEMLDSVLKKAGSVQHLSCLNEHEKAVFKTFSEISPMEVIIQAAQRQKYIDQAQSINLMIHPDTPIKDVNTLILKAWELGVKTLYYQLSVNSAQEFSRNILSCSSCE